MWRPQSETCVGMPPSCGRCWPPMCPWGALSHSDLLMAAESLKRSCESGLGGHPRVPHNALRNCTCQSVRKPGCGATGLREPAGLPMWGGGGQTTGGGEAAGHEEHTWPLGDVQVRLRLVRGSPEVLNTWGTSLPWTVQVGLGSGGCGARGPSRLCPELCVTWRIHTPSLGSVRVRPGTRPMS